MAAKISRKQTYDKAFLKLDFTEINEKSKCVSAKILSTKSMKKKLLRHLESNHPDCINKPVEYFQHKLDALSVQATAMKSFTTVNKCAV